MELAQYRVQWQALVLAVLNHEPWVSATTESVNDQQPYPSSTI
jgi:hypothetical protein